MKKETELERRVAELEISRRYDRDSLQRIWRNVQTICKYLNIQVDEAVYGIIEKGEVKK